MGNSVTKQEREEIEAIIGFDPMDATKLRGCCQSCGRWIGGGGRDDHECDPYDEYGREYDLEQFTNGDKPGPSEATRLSLGFQLLADYGG